MFSVHNDKEFNILKKKAVEQEIKTGGIYQQQLHLRSQTTVTVSQHAQTLDLLQGDSSN